MTNESKTTELSNNQIRLMKRHEEVNALCWRIFKDNPDGKRLLELLIEVYMVDRSTMIEGLYKMFGEMSMAYREGQNDLLRQIKKNIIAYEQIQKQ